MNFLPFSKMKYKTTLTRQGIIDAVLEFTDAYDRFTKSEEGFRNYKKAYYGEVSNEYIEIRRNSRTRSIFRPIIKGEIQRHSKEGCTLQVKMELHGLVIAALGFWMFLTGMISVKMFVVFLQAPASFEFYMIVPFLLFVSGYFFTVTRYNSEVTRSKAYLEDALQMRKCS